MLNIYRIAHNSKIYGPGNRDVVWFKGCSLHCMNCINPELWSFDNAHLMEIDDLVKELKSKEVTFLGGEPLEQGDILLLIKKLKKLKFGIILFTGYEKTELDGDKKKAADLCDVVIYGRYIDKLKDDSLYLRGSLNQEIVFNSKRYNPDDFIKPNSFELNLNDEMELHGRNKVLIKELLEMNR